MKRIITYGTFDVFYSEHVNLLKQAKALGDYMQLPPLEQRTPHHFGGIIDTEHPFTDYLNNEKQ